MSFFFCVSLKKHTYVWHTRLWRFLRINAIVFYTRKNALPTYDERFDWVIIRHTHPLWILFGGGGRKEISWYAVPGENANTIIKDIWSAAALQGLPLRCSLVWSALNFKGPGAFAFVDYNRFYPLDRCLQCRRLLITLLFTRRSSPDVIIIIRQTRAGDGEKQMK